MKNHSAPATCERPRGVRNSDASGGRFRRAEGKFDDEGGALPQFALHFDGAFVRLHHLPGDPETEPEASVITGGNGSFESAENPLLILGGNPDPLIPHHDPRAEIHAL